MSEGAETEEPVSALTAVLRERSSEILASWLVRFERSSLRFQRATKASDHTAQVASLIEGLTVAAATGELQSGSDATRELERTAAFLGAQFASQGATGFDVAAVLLELRDVLAGVAPLADAAALTRLFEWLSVIALDQFAAAGLQSLREQTAEQLDSGTPVLELLPKVPAVMLVGAPSAGVVDSLLARAWMLAVGTGAPCLVIHCAGLNEAGERSLERSYEGFLEQVEGSALQILLAGARRQVRDVLTAKTTERGLAIQHFDRLDSAVAHAVERAGYLLMRRT